MLEYSLYKEEEVFSSLFKFVILCEWYLFKDFMHQQIPIIIWEGIND